MPLLTIITMALGAVRSVINIPGLADSLGVTKYTALIDQLLGTATSLVGHGDVALTELKQFTDEVNTLRARLEAGGSISMAEIAALKAKSDSLHDQFQALKPKEDPVP